MTLVVCFSDSNSQTSAWLNQLSWPLVSWNTLNGFASLPGKEQWKCTHNQLFLCLRRYNKLLFFQLLKLTHVYRSWAVFFEGVVIVYYCTNSIVWFGAMMLNFLKVCQSLVGDFSRDWPQLFTLWYSLFHLHLSSRGILQTNMTSYQLAYWCN